MTAVAPARAVLVHNPRVWDALTVWADTTGLNLAAVPAGPSQTPRYTLTRSPTDPRRSVRGSLGATLTEREQQVLTRIARGMSNGEIGRQLYLSEDTIKTHCRRLFKKLGAKDRANAVAIGYQNGLLGAGPMPQAHADDVIDAEILCGTKETVSDCPLPDGHRGPHVVDVQLPDGDDAT